MQIILFFSFIHHVFNHLTVWKCQSITKRQIYSFFFLFFFSMLLYSFPFPILPFLLPFMHIIVKIVKLDSCPGHWSFVKTVSLSNVFITFTHERAICVVEILPASRHCPKNSKTHAARAKAVISRVMWGFLCYLTFFNKFWLVFLLLTSGELYGHSTGNHQLLSVQFWCLNISITWVSRIPSVANPLKCLFISS